MDSPAQRGLEQQRPILSMIRMQHYCAFITAIYCYIGVAGNYSEIPQSANQLPPFAAFVTSLYVLLSGGAALPKLLPHPLRRRLMTGLSVNSGNPPQNGQRCEQTPTSTHLQINTIFIIQIFNSSLNHKTKKTSKTHFLSSLVELLHLYLSDWETVVIRQ